MHSSPQPSAQVTRAGENIAQMLIPHKLPAIAANLLLDFLEALTEPLEHTLDIASFFHGNDTGVVFLIHPHQEVLLVIVPVTLNSKGKGQKIS